jgi:tetratricopeptide (TPR) repeat protein
MPTVPEALGAALAHHESGRLAEAERLYAFVLTKEPANVAAWHLLGRLKHQAGDDASADRCIRQALGLRPEYPEAFVDLGVILAEANDTAGSIASFRQAIHLNPSYTEAYFGLSTQLLKQKRTAEAAECLARTIELRPDFVNAHYNLGCALYDLGQREQAIACYRRAVELKHDFAEAHYNLGNALQELERFNEAIDCYRRAIQIRPEYAEAHRNLGVTYTLLLMPKEAIESYARATDIRPDDAEHHGRLAEAALLVGDFARGWAEYEWRWQTSQLTPRQFAQPRWVGGRLAGQTILLYTEQGFGDTFQFIRYAALVKETGGTVVVECQRPLVNLLRRCPGIDRLVAAGDELPDFDVQAPLLSLPGIFGTRLETIPANVPYVFAEPELIALWRTKLRHANGFRVGTNWAGREGIGPHKQRSVPVECFEGLTAVPEVRLISLQKDGDNSSLALRACAVDFGEELDSRHGAFMDTAAIMMNLDLVITADTSVAHLAGALGVPVWVALPFAPDWRWMLERSDSPWYPTMRLFRQKSRGDWAGVFQEIEAALREQVRARQE